MNGYIMQLLKLTAFFLAVTNTAKFFKGIGIHIVYICMGVCLHVGIIL